MLAVTGVVSLLFGTLLIAQPLVGGVALMWAVGVYAVVFGVMMIGVGVRALWVTRGASDEAAVGPAGGVRRRHGRMVSAT